MTYMFWVWLAVIILTFVLEFVTMELVSIWFTFGAIVPLILSTTSVGWEIQVVVFVVLSILFVLGLRGVTKKFLLKNTDGKTNLSLIIGKECRMLERTDFETIGSVKVGDVVWSAVGENQEVIEKDSVVKIIRIDGNKLVVSPIKEKGEKSAKEQ